MALALVRALVARCRAFRYRVLVPVAVPVAVAVAGGRDGDDAARAERRERDERGDDEHGCDAASMGVQLFSCSGDDALLQSCPPRAAFPHPSPSFARPLSLQNTAFSRGK